MMMAVNLLISDMIMQEVGKVSVDIALSSISFTTLSLILLSALSFLFASFASTSFISLILTIAAYIIGHSMSDVKALVEASQDKISPVTVKVVQAAYYIFPNLSIFDIKTQAAHDLAIPVSYTFLAVSYGLVYTCIAITLASFIFRRREFP